MQARRVRQRIGTVLDWAKTAGHRTGENPVNGIAKGLPKQPKKTNHHAALPYMEVNSFIRKLDKANVNESTRLAFEFLILTATRTSEVILAEWPEIDLENRSWTIPAKRMKVGKIYHIPLSTRCIEILGQAKEISGSDPYIFSGRSKKNALSNTVFLMVIRRMGYDVTTHGFRSSFRDWAAERTNFSREVCEMALAHTISDKVEAAYLRGDLFDKRRQMMDTWTKYVTAEQVADVAVLRA